MTTQANTAPTLTKGVRGRLKPSSLDALDSYYDDLQRAYYGVGEQYLQVLREVEQNAQQVNADQRSVLRRLPFQLWAAVSAASKRARRQIVFNALLTQKHEYHVDIPPSVVHHVGRIVLGRGFDEKVVMRLFADKGRTAANKTETTTDDLLPVIERVSRELISFDIALAQARSEQEDNWMQSTQYALVYQAITPYISRGDIAAQRLIAPHVSAASQSAILE